MYSYSFILQIIRLSMLQSNQLCFKPMKTNQNPLYSDCCGIEKVSLVYKNILHVPAFLIYTHPYGENLH